MGFSLKGFASSLVDNDAIVSILKTVAPTAASLIGTPIAGTAVAALLDGLLPDNPEPTIDELEEALIAASPETLAKIKEIDANLEIALANANIEVVKTHQKDRSSARELAIATRSLTPTVLGYLTAGATVVALVALMKYSPPDGSRDAVMIILGALMSRGEQVYNYFFGSSKGSADKTDMLNKHANK